MITQANSTLILIEERFACFKRLRQDLDRFRGESYIRAGPPPDRPNVVKQLPQEGV